MCLLLGKTRIIHPLLDPGGLTISTVWTKSRTLFGRNFSLISNSLTVDWPNSDELMAKFVVDLFSKAVF
jgi:hypothetical protein